MRSVTLTAALGLTLVLAGCSTDDEAQSGSTTTGSSTTEAATTTDDGSTTEAAGSTDAAGSTGSAAAAPMADEVCAGEIDGVSLADKCAEFGVQ